MADDKRELVHNEETPQTDSSTPSVTPSHQTEAPPPVYTPGILQEGLQLQNPPGYRAGFPGHVLHQQQPGGPGPYQYMYPGQYAGHGQNQGMPTNIVAPSQVIVIRHAQGAPHDYMAMAILVTIFCCLPFGIVGIIKASEAKDLYATRNYEAAKKASESAGQWSKAGLITGLVCSFVSTGLSLGYYL